MAGGGGGGGGHQCNDTAKPPTSKNEGKWCVD